APPLEVPHIGESQNVAFDRSSRLPRDVWRPVAIVRRFDRAPPDEQRAKGERERGKRGPAPSREQRNSGRRAEDHEQARGDPSRPFGSWKPEPEGERRPRAQEREDQEQNRNRYDRRGDPPYPHPRAPV